MLSELLAPALRWLTWSGVAVSMLLGVMTLSRESEAPKPMSKERELLIQRTRAELEPDPLTPHPSQTLPKALASARDLIDSGQIEAGVRDLETLRAKNPLATEPLIELGTIKLVAQAKPKEALSLWIHALAINPEHRDLMRQVMRLFVKTDLRAGRHFFDRLKVPASMTGVLDYCRGSLLLAEGEAQEAVAYLERAVLDDADSYLAWHALARVRDRLNEGKQAYEGFEEARKRLETVIQRRQVAGEPIENLTSLWSEIQFDAVESLLRHGLLPEAYELLIRLAERLPNDPRVTSLIDNVRDRFAG